MVGFLFVLIMIVCILLILIILIQNPKGGGLSSSFGGSGTQLFGGVKKTTDFLDRGTWALSIALLALVLSVNVMLGGGNSGDTEIQDSSIEEQLNNGATTNPNNINIPESGQDMNTPTGEGALEDEGQ